MTGYKLERTQPIFAIALLTFFQASHSFASPPACDRNTVAKFLFADSAIEAKVVKSRRWKESTTLHLVAKYQVLNVFKGDVKKDSIQIVTTTCLDQKTPSHLSGYPSATPYCPGGFNIHLTGVDSKTGQPAKQEEVSPIWILFLKKDSRKGAPQLTWKEVPTTSYFGGCRRDENDVPKNLLEGFRRMMERENSL